jgi:hypothetical protein
VDADVDASKMGLSVEVARILRGRLHARALVSGWRESLVAIIGIETLGIS